MPRPGDPKRSVAAAVAQVGSSVFSPLAERIAVHPGPIFPLHIGDTWLEPFQGGRMEDLHVDQHPGMHRYCEPGGIPALVDAIVQKVRDCNGLPCQREHVLVTAGATGGLACAVSALADPGADGSLLWSYPKHYLYVPTIYGLAWPLSIFAPAVDAYRLMQILAGLLAGTLNGALFLYLRRRIAALWVCLALVGIWAFSNIHWERALEGQTYFAGQFWAILTLLTFVTASAQVSTRTVWLMAVFTALSGLFHVSNVIVVVPIAVVWIWSRGTEAWRSLGGYLLKAAVLTATLPVLHYRLWNPAELRRWVMTSVNDTEFHSWGAFALPTFSNLVEKSVLPFSGFLVVLGGGPVATITGLVLTALFVAALAIGLTATQRTGKEKDPVVPLAMATFATWAIFFSVIAPGYLFHWEIAAFSLWLLLVAGYLQVAEFGRIWRLKTLIAKEPLASFLTVRVAPRRISGFGPDDHR